MKAEGKPIRVTRSENLTRAREFRDQRLVGIHFDIRESLEGLSTREEVAEAFDRRTPTDGWPPPDIDASRSRANQIGIIYRFLVEPQVGDVMITPTSGAWLVGRITGPYLYRQDGTPMHCYPVRWIGQLARADLDRAALEALRQRPSYFVIKPGSKGYAELEEALRLIPEEQELPVPAPAVSWEEKKKAALAALEQARALVASL